MTKKNIIASKVIGVLLAFTIVSFLLIIVMSSNHEHHHTHEQCEICYCINHLDNLLKKATILSAVTLTVIVVYAFCFIYKLFIDIIIPKKTLISLKTKLTN